ncbi:unnamed protein product [Pleuronectes platessa]|uniref:Uncharacterized protein n=1 Tax=Pleuronectes platessa TaxID=8262 RepID=A0A9N7Y8U2_PLEPL|nr:unnamed protein product [Pleuronectes platessa]
MESIAFVIIRTDMRNHNRQYAAIVSVRRRTKVGHCTTSDMLTHSCRIVLYQEEPRAHCTSVRSDNRSENFLPVPNSSQGTVGYDMEVCATLQGYAFPDHQRPIANPVMLNVVTGSITFTTASPDSFTPVTCAQCKPALICEENRAPKGGPANAGVLLSIPIELHCAGLRAQVPLEVAGPACHPQGVCFCQFESSGRLSKPSCDCQYGCTILEELDYLCNLIRLQDMLTHSCRIVLYQEEPRAHCTSVRSDNRSENFLPVPNSSQGTVGYDMEVCATLQGYAFPDHQRPIANPVMLNVVTGSITFTTASPDSFTPVTCAQCKPALICEENRAPKGGPANAGVLLSIPIELHCAGLRAQVPLEVAGPACHPQGVCFCQFESSGRLSKPSCDCQYGCTILEELDYLCNLIRLQDMLTHSCRIVLYQEEPRAHCTSVRSDNRSENFLPVPNSSQGTVGYDMEVCATLQGYAFPDHQRPIANPVMLNVVTGSITFTTASPDSFTPVTCAQCKPALICEENRAPKGGPANAGVLLSIPIELHCAGLRAQVPLEVAGPACHPQGVCFCQFESSGRLSKPSCDCQYGCTILEELDYLCNLIRLQDMLTHSCRIVLYQEEPRAHCTSVRSDNRSENFLPVPNSSQGTVGYDMEVCATLQGYAFPDHQRPIANPVMLNVVTGSITFTTASPDSFTPVTCAQCKPALICEENRAPKGGPANAGVLLSIPIELHCAGLRAQVPLEVAGPACHPQGVCFCQFESSGRLSKPSCDCQYGCTILEELDYLCNLIRLQDMLTHSCRIVLYQEEPRAHCTSVRSDNRSENFLPVPNSSQGTVGYDMEVCATLQGYAFPDHQRPIANPVMLNVVTGSITFTTASPDSFTPVTCAQCKPALICEENRAPKGGPANAGVLLSIPIELHCAGLRAQVPLEVAGPACHPQGVCFCQFESSGRLSKPSCDCQYGCTILEELDYLCNLIRLQEEPRVHCTSVRSDNRSENVLPVPNSSQENITEHGYVFRAKNIVKDCLHPGHHLFEPLR